MASTHRPHDLLRPRSGKPTARPCATCTGKAKSSPLTRKRQKQQEQLLAEADDEAVATELLASFEGGLVHGHGDARCEGQPTDALPGSPEKVRVLIARAAAGQALFHPQDRRLDKADALRRLRDLVPLREPAESEPADQGGSHG